MARERGERARGRGAQAHAPADTRGKVLLRVQADEATARTRFNVLPARL